MSEVHFCGKCRRHAQVARVLNASHGRLTAAHKGDGLRRVLENLR